MARILSHPFRFGPDRQVATVEQGTDQANTEQLAVLVLTRLGERPLQTGFGITEPAYSGFEPNEVAAGVAEHGPDIDLADIDARYESDLTQLISIRFT